MKNWWLNLSRPKRLLVCLGLVVVGFLLIFLDVSGVLFPFPILARPSALLIGTGVCLFVFDIVFDLIYPDRYIDQVPEDMAQLDLAQHWVSVPPEKLEATFDALAQNFGGAFAIQKLALLSAAAHIKANDFREFPLMVHLNNAPASVNVRLTCSADGLIGCGFFAEPQLLAQIKSVLGPILT